MSCIARSTVGGFVAFIFAGCGSDPTAPLGEVTLASLQFARSEVAAGQPLILIAQPAAGESLSPVPVTVRASSGAEQQTWVSPWDSLSNSDLTAVIAEHDGEVMVRFKEAGAARGIDDRGYNITSRETFERMKQWLRDQGVTITREFEFVYSASVAATMEANEELVSRIRNHENVDIFEPNTRGWPETVGPSSSSSDLVAVVATGHGGFSVRLGDTVTAAYRQPDGTLLTATVLIRQ